MIVRYDSSHSYCNIWLTNESALAIRLSKPTPIYIEKSRKSYYEGLIRLAIRHRYQFKEYPHQPR